MSNDNICLRCGEELNHKGDEYGVTLAHISNLKSLVAKIPEEERTEYLISFLLEKTDEDIDKITEYVIHRMNRCTLKTRDCPKCGNRLKTWRAKLCLECGVEFEPLYYRKPKT